MNDIEIRRLKIKLKLFEEEGFNWVLNDILDAKTPWQSSAETIEELRLEYLQKLKKLCPPDNKQGKLDI